MIEGYVTVCAVAILVTFRRPPPKTIVLLRLVLLPVTDWPFREHPREEYYKHTLPSS